MPPDAARRSGLAFAAAVLTVALAAACTASTARQSPRPASTPTGAAPTAARATAAATTPATTAVATVAASQTHDPLAHPSTTAAPTTTAAGATQPPAQATVAPAIVATPNPTLAPSAATTAPAPATAAPAAGAVAVVLTDTAVQLDRASAAAGSVTFAIKNVGSVIHQLVVLKTDVPQDKIPVDTAQAAKVTQPGFVTETKDIAPGASTTLALTLAAGKYVLMCNQPAHYLIGMHTAFTIN